MAIALAALVTLATASAANIGARVLRIQCKKRLNTVLCIASIAIVVLVTQAVMY